MGQAAGRWWGYGESMDQEQFEGEKSSLRLLAHGVGDGSCACEHRSDGSMKTGGEFKQLQSILLLAGLVARQWHIWL